MNDYKCQSCGEFISEDKGITCVDGSWACDKDLCRALDYENDAHLLINVEITLEQRIRVCKDFKVTKYQLEELLLGINPFDEELKAELDSVYEECDYAVCDGDGNTIVPWNE